MGFTGYVLAGGKSSRMGSDKFALQIGGETFLSRAADALKAVCADVLVILNQSQSLDTDLPVVRDVYQQRGALGGIHAAFSNCKTEFAVILAVDLPFVTADAIEKLTKIARECREFSVFVPLQSDGRLQPLCAVYRVRDCLSKAQDILESRQSASVRDFLETVLVFTVNQTDLSDDPELFFNANTPADLEKLVK